MRVTDRPPPRLHASQQRPADPPAFPARLTNSFNGNHSKRRNTRPNCGMDPDRKPSILARILFLILAIPFFYLVYLGITWLMKTAFRNGGIPVP